MAPEQPNEFQKFGIMGRKPSDGPHDSQRHKDIDDLRAAKTKPDSKTYNFPQPATNSELFGDPEKNLRTVREANRQGESLRERAANLETRYRSLRDNLLQKNEAEWEKLFAMRPEWRGQPLATLKDYVSKLNDDSASRTYVERLINLGQWIKDIDDAYVKAVGFDPKGEKVAALPHDGSGKIWGALEEYGERRDATLAALDQELRTKEAQLGIPSPAVISSPSPLPRDPGYDRSSPSERPSPAPAAVPESKNGSDPFSRSPSDAGPNPLIRNGKYVRHPESPERAAEAGYGRYARKIENEQWDAQKDIARIVAQNPTIVAAIPAALESVGKIPVRFQMTPWIQNLPGAMVRTRVWSQQEAMQFQQLDALIRQTALAQSPGTRTLTPNDLYRVAPRTPRDTLHFLRRVLAPSPSVPSVPEAKPEAPGARSWESQGKDFFSIPNQPRSTGTPLGAPVPGAAAQKAAEEAAGDFMRDIADLSKKTSPAAPDLTSAPSTPGAAPAEGGAQVEKGPGGERWKTTSEIQAAREALKKEIDRIKNIPFRVYRRDKGDPFDSSGERVRVVAEKDGVYYFEAIPKGKSVDDKAMEDVGPLLLDAIGAHADKSKPVMGYARFKQPYSRAFINSAFFSDRQRALLSLAAPLSPERNYAFFLQPDVRSALETIIAFEKIDRAMQTNGEKLSDEELAERLGAIVLDAEHLPNARRYLKIVYGKDMDSLLPKAAEIAAKGLIDHMTVMSVTDEKKLLETPECKRLEGLLKGGKDIDSNVRRGVRAFVAAHPVITVHLMAGGKEAEVRRTLLWDEAAQKLRMEKSTTPAPSLAPGGAKVEKALEDSIKLDPKLPADVKAAWEKLPKPLPENKDVSPKGGSSIVFRKINNHIYYDLNNDPSFHFRDIADCTVEYDLKDGKLVKREEKLEPSKPEPKKEDKPPAVPSPAPAGIPEEKKASDWNFTFGDVITYGMQQAWDDLIKEGKLLPEGTEVKQGNVSFKVRGGKLYCREELPGQELDPWKDATTSGTPKLYIDVNGTMTETKERVEKETFIVDGKPFDVRGNPLRQDDRNFFVTTSGTYLGQDTQGKWRPFSAQGQWVGWKTENSPFGMRPSGIQEEQDGNVFRWKSAGAVVAEYMKKKWIPPSSKRTS